MADDGIGTGGNEFVFWEEGEIECEEGPERAVASKAEEGSCGDEGETEEEEGCWTDEGCGRGGGGTEDRGESGGEGGAGEVL